MESSKPSHIPWSVVTILLVLTLAGLLTAVFAYQNERISLQASLFGFALLILFSSVILLLIWRKREIEFYRERYRAEVKQRALDEGLDFVTHLSNDIVLLMDDKWRIVQANEKVIPAYGYQPEEICRLSLQNLQTEASLSEFDRQAEEMRRRGTINYETIHRRKDYAAFPVECTSRAINIDGKTYYQIVIHDITERRRAEMELRESESRFRIFYEQAPVAYHLLDKNGKIQDVNKSWLTLFGYARDEVIGKPFSTFITDETRIHFEQSLNEIKITGEIQGEELVIVRSNGNQLIVALFARANVDGSGNMIQAHCILHDITDKRLAQEKIRRMNEELEQRVLQRTAQLEAANRELEAFSYSVSHDLRAPLRAIDGFSKILIEEYENELSGDAHHYLDRVRENTRIMSNLIDNLLSFSRLSRQPLNKQVIDLKPIIEQSLELLTSDSNFRNPEVTILPLPACQADPALVKQVYVNLLSNAIKFTSKREKPCIEVGCLHENHEDIYYVKDNGVGFDMQYAKKLFGVFQRLHRAEDYEGTGVGLAIVQRIIHRHGGRIWATSEVNQGATFCFTLEGANGNG